MIIKAAIMGQLIGIDWTTEQDAVVTQLGRQTIGFTISFCVSALGAVFAMLMFIKSGPCGIIGERWSRVTVMPTWLYFISGCTTLQGKIFFLINLMPGTSGSATVERAIVWVTFMILPQLLLSLIAIGRATGCRRLFPTIGQFPALLATPVFFSLTFGPNTKKGYLAFSPKYTLMNVGITMVLTVALSIIAVYVYAVSFGKLSIYLVSVILGQLITLTFAVKIGFPNSKLKSLPLIFDVAALNFVNGESEAVVDNLGN